MSGKRMKKKPTLKARGIRFSDKQWARIGRDAKADRTGRTTPSDIVRGIVDNFYENKDKDQVEE